MSCIMTETSNSLPLEIGMNLFLINPFFVNMSIIRVGGQIILMVVPRMVLVLV